MKNRLKIWWKNIDRVSLLIVLSLLFIGIILSFSTNDQVLLSQKHLLYVVSSILILLSLSSFDLKFIRRFALFGLLISGIVMIMILFMNYEVNGAKRWLKFWNFSLQPSEFLKPFYIVITGWFLTKGIEGNKFAFYIVFISFLIFSTLLILQPDFGMTILFSSTFLCQLFIAGLSISLVLLAIILLIILFFSSYYLFDHVQARIDLFFYSEPGYQITKSLNAFKSGGIFGKGPGQGSLKDILPEAHTDFIFAVAGEEFGFIFCSIIIFLFFIIVIRNLLKVLKIQEPYVILSIVGLICSFGLQTLINIFSSLDLIPTKGMTLPLVSYGGSSMLSTAILVGFLFSFTRKNNHEKK